MNLNRTCKKFEAKMKQIGKESEIPCKVRTQISGTVSNLLVIGRNKNMGEELYKKRRNFGFSSSKLLVTE